MKTILVASVAAATLLAGCGGGGNDDALRKEVAALRQQVAATSTAAPPTTVTSEASTATTQAPATTTTKPPTPTTQRATPTTQRATTTTAPPTTTTTAPFIKPVGTVTWTVKDPRPNGPTCVAFTYTVFNRSDTALKDVTISNVYNQETYKDTDGTTKNRWGNPNRFPEQKVAAGIAPYGQGDVQVNWCPDSITPGTTAQFPVHIGEGRGGPTLTTAMGWNWFFTWPEGGSAAGFPGCCAWWDQNTKTGHEQQ